MTTKTDIDFWDSSNVLITGGAGFIGSHLGEALVENAENITLTIVDNLENGREQWVPEQATFIESRTEHTENYAEELHNSDWVFHLSASKYVNTDKPFEQHGVNTRQTREVVRTASESDTPPDILFTSSSTVYGEGSIPSKETQQLNPISYYGASKLADEGLLATYANQTESTVYALRLANIVGARLRNAVIPDFIDKLQTNNDSLEILGNGKQRKSYMYISDCVESMLWIPTAGKSGFNAINVGTDSTTSVDEIAEIVCDVLNLNPDFEYTGGVKGWEGDVPKMKLDITRLAAEYGFIPQHNSTEAVEKTAKELRMESL